MLKSLLFLKILLVVKPLTLEANPPCAWHVLEVPEILGQESPNFIAVSMLLLIPFCTFECSAESRAVDASLKFFPAARTTQRCGFEYVGFGEVLRTVSWLLAASRLRLVWLWLQAETSAVGGHLCLCSLEVSYASNRHTESPAKAGNNKVLLLQLCFLQRCFESKRGRSMPFCTRFGHAQSSPANGPRRRWPNLIGHLKVSRAQAVRSSTKYSCTWPQNVRH